MNYRKIALFVVLIFSVNHNSFASDSAYSFLGNSQSGSAQDLSFVLGSGLQGELQINQEINVDMPGGRNIGGEVVTSLVEDVNQLEKAPFPQPKGDGRGSDRSGVQGRSSVDSRRGASDEDTTAAPIPLEKQGKREYIIALEEGSGSLTVSMVNQAVVGLRLFDANAVQYYVSEVDSNGRGNFRLDDANNYQCVDFPYADANANIPMDHSVGRSVPEGITLDLATLQSLESKPGSSHVIYLDFWGGTLSGTVWNNNYNSGNDIVYTPYSYDADPTTFTTQEFELMWIAWSEVAEDFAPFDVNITTDVNVFNAATNANKVRNIASDTNYFLPGWGGYAYTGWGNTSDYTQASWTWNSGVGSFGMTISHEVGHQLGLSHDGTSTSSYYGGHGDWGPIMGAPFYQTYVQWSKGEYPDANQAQDDIVIINNQLGPRIDEVNPTQLTFPIDFDGVISPDGIYTSSFDTDNFDFTLAASSVVNLSIVPKDQAYFGTNLSMRISLSDSDNVTEYGNSVPTGDPAIDGLSFSGTLPAGTYTVEISNDMYNSDWNAGGFGYYGNGGIYTITGDATGNQTFDDVPPSHWAFEEIENLAALGITSGCSTSPSLYCPNQAVSRAQMAIFLLRAKHGASYTPPPATGTVFLDVPASYWAAGWIEQLASEGITSGCAAGYYCPSAEVTRAQMSIFLLRTEHGSSYAPPAATGVFTDVATSYWAASWIEQLYSEGITGGCTISPLSYCPNDSVSRAQMAVFLTRAFFPIASSLAEDSVVPEGAHPATIPPTTAPTDI